MELLRAGKGGVQLLDPLCCNAQRNMKNLNVVTPFVQQKIKNYFRHT